MASLALASVSGTALADKPFAGAALKWATLAWPQSFTDFLLRTPIRSR